MFKTFYHSIVFISFILLIIFSTFTLANVIQFELIQGSGKPAYSISSLQQMRRGVGSSGSVIPLKGGFDIGEWYAGIELGTPPQKLTVQVDTGSADLLVYSSGCTSCGPDKIFFNSNKTKTLTNVGCGFQGFRCPTCINGQCGFKNVYGSGTGGSIAGPIVFDDFLFTTDSSSEKSANVSFGLIEKSSPNFEPTGVDGIMGIGYDSLTAWGETTSYKAFVEANNLIDAFEMCINDKETSTWTIGRDYLKSTGLQFTPITKEVWYVVEMTDFKINGKSVGVPPSVYNEGQFGTFVDSGTTELLLPGKAYDVVQATLESMCDDTNLVGVCNVTKGNSLFAGECYLMTQEDRAAFPPVSVSLAGVDDMVITGEQYLIPASSNGETFYCLGFESLGPIPSPKPGCVLGDVFMRAVGNVVFDRVNKRLGFGPASTCER